MNIPTNNLSIEELKEKFIYDPNEGTIMSKNRYNGGYTEVGHLDSRGYYSVTFKGKSIKAHRLAWVLYYGRFPVDELDHINRIRTDNRICNLREADRYLNNQNRQMRPREDRYVEYQLSLTRRELSKTKFELDKMSAFIRLLSGEHPSKIKNLKIYFPYSFINDLN